MTNEQQPEVQLPAPLPVAEALAVKLPTRKERLIHRRICIEGRFVEEVARDQTQSLARVQLTAASVQQWLVPVQTDVDSHQTGALHLERLEHQWREAMAAWYRSGQQAEVVKVSIEGVGKRPRAAAAKEHSTPAAAQPDGKQKVERTMRGGCGDVRYLEQARRIMAEIRALTAVVEQMTQAQRETDVEQLTPAERAESAAGAIVCLLERQDASADRSALGGADAGGDA